MSNVVWRQLGTAADDHTMNACRGIACGTLGVAWKAGKSRVSQRAALGWHQQSVTGGSPHLPTLAGPHQWR
jgi:hypothetical protein